LISASFQSAAGADFGFCPDGIIRDDIFKGKSGVQSFSDIFRLSPLGIGELDEEIGYPIIKIYVNGKEIKQILEVLQLAYIVKGSTYHPRFSGIEFDYNPYRIPLDRIMEARIKKADGTIEIVDFNDEKRLYSIGMTSYIGKFFWVVPEVSMGLFKLVPKDAQGHPIEDIKNAIVFQPGKPGHEYKSWLALYDYIQKLPKDESSDLPAIPTSGNLLRNPMHELPSIRPAALFKNATWIQYSGFAIGLMLLALLSSILLWIVFKVRKFVHSSAR